MTSTMKTLSACLIAIMMSYFGRAYAQKDSLRPPLNVEVEDSVLTVKTSGTVVLDREKLDQLVLDVTRLAEVIQKETIASRKTIGKLEKDGKLEKEEVAKLQQKLTTGMEQSADTLEKLMTTGTRQEWDIWKVNFQENMEEWRNNLREQASTSNSSTNPADSSAVVPPPPPSVPPIPPIPPIPSVKGKTNLVDSTVVESAQGKTITISSRGIEVTSGSGDKPLVIQFKEKVKMEVNENHENEETQKEDEDCNDNNHSTTTSTVNFDYGFNQLLLDGEEFVQDGSMEHQFWGSNVVELSFGLKTRIGGVKSPLYINYAAGISWHDFKFRNNNLLEFDNNGNTIFVTDNTRRFEKSKFKMTYLNVPVMLELDFTKENYEINNGFRMGVGGYGGVRLNGKRKIEYNDDNFNSIEEEAKGDLNSNLLRYGLMAQIGWKDFNITGKYDLNRFFQDNKGPEVQLFSVALGFTWQ